MCLMKHFAWRNRLDSELGWAEAGAGQLSNGCSASCLAMGHTSLPRLALD